MELPGVAGDASFVKELQAKRQYFQALKCVFHHSSCFAVVMTG